MTVGERIRAERIRQQLTQKELGEKCGIAEPTIRRYELGGLNPKLSTIERIAMALGVPIAELAGLSVENKQGSTEDTDVSPGIEISIEQKRAKKLLTYFEMLNSKGQQEAIKRIDELSQLPAYQLRPVPPEYKIIGKRIKKAREQKRLSYSQLGEMCQLSAEDILSIEAGKKAIPLQAMKYFSSNLGIRMTDLYVLTSEEQEKVKQCYDALELLNSTENNSNTTDESKIMFQRKKAEIERMLATICDAAAERVLNAESDSKA